MPGSSAGMAVHSDLNVSVWCKELESACDRDFLINGVINGFDIIRPSCILHKVAVQNHKSVLVPEVRRAIELFILGELAERTVLQHPSHVKLSMRLGQYQSRQAEYVPYWYSREKLFEQLCSAF